MGGQRIKIILKWSVLLVIVAFVSQFVAAFLVGIIGGLFLPKPLDENSLLLIAAIVGALAVLPFAYYFCYWAVIEAFKASKEKLPKNFGLNISVTVVLIASLLGGILGYLLTGNFNVSYGLLPLILSYLAGKHAEKSLSR